MISLKFVQVVRLRKELCVLKCKNCSQSFPECFGLTLATSLPWNFFLDSRDCVTTIQFFGNLVAVVCPSPSYNNGQKVHAVLDNERIVTILRITEASEDTISEALFASPRNECFLFSPLIL